MEHYKEASISLEYRVNDMLRKLPVDHPGVPSKEEEIADLTKLLEKAETEMRDAWLRANRLRRELVKLRA